MARIIRADGTTEALDVPETGLSLETMRSVVGGTIEIVYLGGTRYRREVLIVLDDGHLRGLPVNDYATARYRGTPPRHDWVIVGDVIEAVVVNPGLDAERFI